jgi:hypothetical protein
MEIGVLDETVNHGGCHGGVTEDFAPLTEAFVRFGAKRTPASPRQSPMWSTARSSSTSPEPLSHRGGGQDRYATAE